MSFLEVHSTKRHFGQKEISGKTHGGLKQPDLLGRLEVCVAEGEYNEVND